MCPPHADVRRPHEAFLEVTTHTHSHSLFSLLHASSPTSEYTNIFDLLVTAAPTNGNSKVLKPAESAQAAYTAYGATATTQKTGQLVPSAISPTNFARPRSWRRSLWYRIEVAWLDRGHGGLLGSSRSTLFPLRVV